MYKRNKYGNQKSEKYGRKWDSKMELQFYEYLLELKEAGDVLEIECQPVFVLQEKFKYKNRLVRAISYKADFMVKYKDNSVIIWDVKGQVLSDFKLKWKMVINKNSDMDFRCIRKLKGEWVEVKVV